MLASPVPCLLPALPAALPLPDLGAADWAMLIAAAALAGIAKTALPGAATIAVALCAAVLPAKESTGAMLLMLMTGDLLAVWAYRRDADLAMLRRLVPAVVTGVAAGAIFLALASNDSTRRVIGALLLALIAITLWQRRRAVGSLAGFPTMVANAGGPVTSMYFLACRYPVKAFLGTTAWFFFAVNLVKLPFSVSIGLVNPTTVALAVAVAPVVVLAALAGRRLAQRMEQRIFEPVVIALTIISALPLLV